jgi:hypothetical protein
VLTLVVLLLLAAVAFAGWYFFIRDDSSAKPAAKAKAKPTPTASTKSTSGATATERAFVVGIDKLVRESAADRSKIVAAVSATQNGCSMPLDKAAAQVNSVATSRTALLRQARSLPAPTPQAVQLKRLFVASLTNSIAANKAFAAWMTGLKGASPCPGSTAGNTHFAAAQSASARATAAKTAFVQAYNPVARRYGRRTWTEAQI